MKKMKMRKNTTTFTEFTGGSGFRRTSGFTMLEIMIVVSILVTLAAIAVVYGQGFMRGVQEKGAGSQIRRIQLAIDEYRQITGHYPPDGIDSTIRNAQKTELRGSAALHHALTTSFRYTVMTGGLPRQMEHEPLMQFKEAELTSRLEDYPGVREITDPFGNPLHYDNTENRIFRAQGGSVHYPPLEDDQHPPDPRTLAASEGGVSEPGSVQSTTYDLWSHGKTEHDPNARPEPTATWNLDR